MSKQIVKPPDIRRIFNKPGGGWTPKERRRVKMWLYEDPQLTYLLHFALRHLCRTANDKVQPEDAEDTWGKFNAHFSEGENRWIFPLDRVIDSYTPNKGRRFWNYLLLCFERFCHDEGKRIRKRREREEPLERQVETEEGETIQFEIVDTQSLSPEEILLLKERKGILEKCINKLSEEHRKVILMHYFDESSFSKIADSLGGSSGTWKTRCCRARQNLARCVRKEGIT